MRKLIWKEWHEHHWKLAFLCIVLAALAFIGLRSRIVADEQMVMWVCVLGMGLLPVLSCASLIPAERGEGTLESLLALPVTPRQVLAVKTATGLLLCAAPMAAAAVVSLAVAANREMTASAMIALYIRSMLTALSLFIWMQTLTIRLPSEARAALLSVGVLILWLSASAGLAIPRIPAVAATISPFFFVLQRADPRYAALLPGIALAVQLPVALVVWLWAARALAPGRY